MTTEIVGWALRAAAGVLLVGGYFLQPGTRHRHLAATGAGALLVASLVLELHNVRALVFVAMYVAGALLIARALHRPRCWHHDVAGGWQSSKSESWVKVSMIDTGMRKMLWCTKCGRTDFV